MKLYAMKDLKVGTFGGVMMGVSDGHIGRIIKENFKGSGHTVERYPQDFDLFELGEMNPESGGITVELRFVCNVGVLLTEG